MWFSAPNGPLGAKAAVTEVAAVTVIVQVVAVPVQVPPDHPLKMLFVAGVAVSTTCVFCAKLAEQPVFEPEVQEIPPWLLVTVPVPVPAVVTVILNVGPITAVNVAETLVAALTVTWQVRVMPEQAPPHPPKV